ncbi:hypothetical protein D9M72_592570 [compost metagenome]
MFDTERYQPTRVCTVASGFSKRMLGIAYAMLVKPMPSSNAASWFMPGANNAVMLGATVRCNQPDGRPSLFRLALRYSADTVWK